MGSNDKAMRNKMREIRIEAYSVGVKWFGQDRAYSHAGYFKVPSAVKEPGLFRWRLGAVSRDVTRANQTGAFADFTPLPHAEACSYDYMCTFALSCSLLRYFVYALAF